MRIVVLGASDALGIGSRNPPDEGWAARIQSALAPDDVLDNLSEWGADAADALRRQLPLALALAPDVALVWLGMNDLARGVARAVFADALEAIVARLRARGTDVVLGTLIDPTLVPALAGLPFDVSARNMSIVAIAQHHGARLVDLAAYGVELAAHPDYVSDDGFHPSTAGHVRLAELFMKALPRR